MTQQELFDPTPKVRSALPENPEASDPSKAVKRGRFPSWLHRKLPRGGNLWKTGDILGEKRLHTVCEEARCPNLMECWTRKTATFLIMGKECTRACGFCEIDFAEAPKPLEADEPQRVAESSKALGLRHVVITMVARDDREDGGAPHVAETIRAVKAAVPDCTVEVLTWDFNGCREAWDTVLAAEPDIFNYNIETVRELTPRVRHRATYERTLELLEYVKVNRPNPKMLVKSGIMVGLGETVEQVEETLRDLQGVGCDVVTIGQYLQPSKRKLRVKSFVTPEQFEAYKTYGETVGIRHMYCGPFVRSSYNADKVLAHLNTN